MQTIGIQGDNVIMTVVTVMTVAEAAMAVEAVKVAGAEKRRSRTCPLGQRQRYALSHQYRHSLDLQLRWC